MKKKVEHFWVLSCLVLGFLQLIFLVISCYNNQWNCALFLLILALLVPLIKTLCPFWNLLHIMGPQVYALSSRLLVLLIPFPILKTWEQVGGFIPFSSISPSSYKVKFLQRSTLLKVCLALPGGQQWIKWQHRGILKVNLRYIWIWIWNNKIIFFSSYNPFINYLNRVRSTTFKLQFNQYEIFFYPKFLSQSLFFFPKNVIAWWVFSQTYG